MSFIVALMIAVIVVVVSRVAGENGARANQYQHGTRRNRSGVSITVSIYRTRGEFVLQNVVVLLNFKSVEFSHPA